MASMLREAVRSFKRRRLEQALEAATGPDVKGANAMLNWREYWHGRTTLTSRPRLVQVGTNWTCNLKCNFCRLTLPSTQRELKAKPPRELQISDRVFDEVMRILPYPELITLTPLGEPLLYSRFGEVLEAHRRANSRNLAMTTNANLINDDRARLIVEGGMVHLFVSVDAVDAEIYGGMRVRGEIEKVEAALDAINRWKSKLNSATPTMTLASTFMERNVDEMPKLYEFAVKHRFKDMNIQLMETENEELESEFLGHHIEKAQRAVLATLRLAQGRPVEAKVHLAFRNLLTKGLSLPDAKLLHAASDGTAGTDLAEAQLTKLSTRGKRLTEKCHYPWYFALIDTDGDVRPCCWTGITFGNLNQLDWQDIWNGETATKMRADFLRNHIPKGCQDKHCRVDLDHEGTRE